MSGTRPSSFLLLVCLALAWLVYAEAKTEISSVRSDATQSRGPTPAKLPPGLPEFSLAPLDAFTETAARPLFMPTRRPPDPELVEQSAAPDKPQPINVTITGVIISDDDLFALVQRQRSNDVLRLAPGDEIDGWKVDAVLADRVVFRRGDEVEEIELRDQARPKAERRPNATRPKQEIPRRGTRTPSRPANQPATGQTPRRNAPAN